MMACSGLFVHKWRQSRIGKFVEAVTNSFKKLKVWKMGFRPIAGAFYQGSMGRLVQNVRFERRGRDHLIHRDSVEKNA